MNNENQMTEANTGDVPALVVATGELTIWEEEGGHCSPAISVKTEAGEISLEDLIEQVIPGCPMGGGGTGHRVEITIQRLAPTPPNT